MRDLLIVAYLAAVAVAAFVIPALRNIRFLAVAIVMAAVIVGVAALPSPTRTAIRLLAVAVISVAMVVPELVGLGSLRREERRADDAFLRAHQLAAGSEPGGVEAAIGILDGVLADDRSLDAAWRACLRTERRALLSSLGSSALPASSATPADSNRVAAVHMLNDLRLRRTLGFRPRSGPFDEAMVLRTYLEDVRSIMPPGPIWPNPTPAGAWRVAVDAAIAELRAVPLRDDGALAVRASLADMLALEAAMRVTAPTATDQVTYDQLGAELDERWRRLDAPLWAAVGRTPPE
jgi:hypothetical protein